MQAFSVVGKSFHSPFLAARLALLSK